MSRQQPPIVGVIGSIGSGKSAVAAAVAQRLDGLWIDADQVGHAVLLRTDVRSELVDAFGEKILNAHGQIDRRYLAMLVFGGDSQQLDSRQKLERIVHPIIHSQIHSIIGQTRQEGQARCILLDAAVLLEAGWEKWCDAIICVDANRDIRAQRVQNRGWDAAELMRRETSQLPIDVKRNAADFVIENSGELETAVGEAVDHLCRHFPALVVHAPGTGATGLVVGQVEDGPSGGFWA